MSTVFISYSRNDMEFVRWLNGALTARNQTTWVDWSGIKPTAKWLEEIYTAIEGADNFAFVISPDSVSSEICQKEIAHASENNKRMIPILLRKVSAKALPLPLAGVQWIDFTASGGSESALQSLVDAFETNPEWTGKHTRLIVRAREWEIQGRDSSFLLRGMDLQDAVQWLAQALGVPKQQPTSLQEQYIRASQEWEAEEIKRLNELIEEKERQRQEAERQRRIAVAGKLAAHAELTRNQAGHLLERSVLLALESLRRWLSLEADQALRRGLAILPLLPVRQLAHGDSLHDVTYSSDGQYLATASSQGAHVWDAKRGREIMRLGHQGHVTMVSFSPDTRYLATANTDHSNGVWEAHVWEVANGREVSRMIYGESVTSLAFSPNGRFLATTSYDHSAQVWDVFDGRRLFSRTYDQGVVAAAFSPDGRVLATAGHDHTARILEVPTWRERACMTHGHYVSDVSFSGDGKYLATASWDKSARLWNVSTGEEASRLTHKGFVRAVAFSPDGKHLGTISENTAHVWEAPSGREIARLNADVRTHRDVLVFSPDGKYLAANLDGTTRVWDVMSGLTIAIAVCDALALSFSPDGRRLAAAPMGEAEAMVWEDITTPRGLLRHGDGVLSLAFSPDGLYLATASGDHTAVVWETRNGREVSRLDHDGPVTWVAFSRDGKRLATASEDRTARVWEPRSGRQTALMGHEKPVTRLAFSPNAKYLATASAEDVRVWELETGRELGTLRHAEPVKRVAFCSKEEWLATASEDHFARVWDVRTRLQVVRMEHDDQLLQYFIPGPGDELVETTRHGGRLNDLAFNDDGRYLATASGDRTARVWDAMSGKELARIAHPNEVGRACLDPDGKYLATIARSLDLSVRIWEWASGREVVRLYTEGQPQDLAFSPCGRYLAAGSADCTARVWETATGTEVMRIDHGGPVNIVAFSQDGRYLATASDDGTARISVRRPEDLVAEANARLTRNLIREEWSQYLPGEPYSKTCPHLPESWLPEITISPRTI